MSNIAIVREDLMLAVGVTAGEIEEYTRDDDRMRMLRYRADVGGVEFGCACPVHPYYREAVGDAELRIASEIVRAVQRAIEKPAASCPLPACPSCCDRSIAVGKASPGEICFACRMIKKAGESVESYIGQRSDDSDA